MVKKYHCTTFAIRPQQTTKRELKNYLKKSNATVTYIFDILSEFLSEKRKRSLGKRKNEQFFYQINWVAIIDFLINDSKFDLEKNQASAKTRENGHHQLISLIKSFMSLYGLTPSSCLKGQT